MHRRLPRLYSESQVLYAQLETVESPASKVIYWQSGQMFRTLGDFLAKYDGLWVQGCRTRGLLFT